MATAIPPQDPSPAGQQQGETLKPRQQQGDDTDAQRARQHSAATAAATKTAPKFTDWASI